MALKMSWIVLLATVFALLSALVPVTSGRAILDLERARGTANETYPTTGSRVQEHSAQSLNKRADCQRRSAFEWFCTDEYPNLEQARRFAMIPDELRQPPKKTFAFYQGLGGVGAVALINQWCTCDAERRQRWGECLTLSRAGDFGAEPGTPGPPGWINAATANMYSVGKRSRVPLELAAQVYAERATGDVLYFTRDELDVPGSDLSAPRRSTVIWFAWEYPALQRNPNVNRVFRADPRPGATGGVRLLWDRERDGITTDEPRGVVETDPPIFERDVTEVWSSLSATG